jgi:hypothetical protein
MSMWFWLIVFVASVVALRVYCVYRERKVAEVAARLGLAFSPSERVFGELHGLYLTRLGENPRIDNCIAGEADGTRVRIFEYRCTFGRQEAPASHTVVLLTCEDLDAPQLLIRPKHRMSILDPYAQLAPGPVLVRGDFDKDWIATGEDSRAVRQLFDDELIAFVKSNKWWIEARGSRLALYRWNHTVNHTLLERFFRQAFQALLLLKARCPAAASAEPSAEQSDATRSVPVKLAAAR